MIAREVFQGHHAARGVDCVDGVAGNGALVEGRGTLAANLGEGIAVTNATNRLSLLGDLTARAVRLLEVALADVLLLLLDSSSKLVGHFEARLVQFDGGVVQLDPRQLTVRLVQSFEATHFTRNTDGQTSDDRGVGAVVFEDRGIASRRERLAEVDVLDRAIG